jgi:hypothetical protein
MPQAVVTNTVVLRGRYQTLPVALYGWTIALDNGQQALHPSIEYSASWQPPAALPPAFAGAWHELPGAPGLPQGPELLPLSHALEALSRLNKHAHLLSVGDQAPTYSGVHASQTLSLLREDLLSMLHGGNGC